MAARLASEVIQGPRQVLVAVGQRDVALDGLVDVDAALEQLVAQARSAAFSASVPGSTNEGHCGAAAVRRVRRAFADISGAGLRRFENLIIIYPNGGWEDEWNKRLPRPSWRGVSRTS